MGFSVNWRWIAALSCLLIMGDAVWCDCTMRGIDAGVNYTLSNELKEGSILRYLCADGYYPYPDQALKCQLNNRWDPEPSRSQRCKLVQCPDPTVLENGHILPIRESRKYYFKEQITYRCKSEYNLYGPSQRTCLSSGKWSGSNPVCRRDSRDCPDPGIPPGGRKSGNIYEIGEKVTYGCKSNMILIGSEERLCQVSGQWSGNEPTCYYKHTYDSRWEVSQAFGGEIRNTISLLVNKTQEQRSINLMRNGTLNIYIAVDISESINEQDYENAKKAVVALITKIEDFSVFPNYDVVFFSSKIHEVISILEFTENKKKLIDYVNKFKNFKLRRQDKVGTNLNAVFRRFEERIGIIKEREKDFAKHQHVIIVFTDGGYNTGGSPTGTVERIKSMVYMNQELERLKNLDIYVFAVGAPVYDDVLRPLTVGTGGRHYFRLKNNEELHETFEEMINEEDMKASCGLYRDYGDMWDSKDKRKKFPWVMYITVMASPKPKYCLGSLVSPRFVLTAAHCFPSNDTAIQVEFSDGQLLDVEGIHIHPKFNLYAKNKQGISQFYDYDVALIRLQADVPIGFTLRPICIPCTEETNNALRQVLTCKEQEQLLLKNRDKLTFLTKNNLEEKEVHVKLEDDRYECISKALLAPNISTTDVSEVVTDNFLCTGGQNPYVDKISCKGESGGAVFKNHERRTIQVALVSWGTKIMPRCEKHDPVNYPVESDENSRDFHINLFKVVPFLKSILGKKKQPYAPLTFVD